MPLVSTGRTISTSEYLERKNKVRRKKLIIIGSGIFLVLVTLILLMKLPQLQIKEVQVSGATVTGEEAVRAALEESLSGSYLWLVPHSNVIFYRKGHMKAELAKQFPRFSNIEVSLDGLEILSVSVSEREPSAMYCENTEKCFFLDERGFIFDEAPSFSEGVYFVYSHDPALSEPLGQFMIPTEEFAALKQFIESLKPLGFRFLSGVISFEDISLQLSGGGVMIFKRGEDLERLTINLTAFLRSPTIAGEEDFINRLSQLDLRTTDKVFYKFK